MHKKSIKYAIYKYLYASKEDWYTFGLGLNENSKVYCCCKAKAKD